MKKIKYILLFILSVGLFNSCLIDDTTDLDANDDGFNVVTFDRQVFNLTGTADGSEYLFKVPMKIVGPTSMDLTNDITVTITADASSTAVDGVMYRIENPTFTLTKDQNYLGYLEITLITAGNAAPMDGTPEFEDYVAPVLVLNITATGDPKVVGSGKQGVATLNFIPPNPYAGLYDVVMRYFHPTQGGSYPPSTNFDDPYGGIRYSQKELEAVTGRKCETGFAVWPDTDLCWITINADNSIVFVVDTTWPYDVSLGDPFDASAVSYYDDVNHEIHLIYHYYGTGGARIFYEDFTLVVK